jgi:hypothetical protein
VVDLAPSAFDQVHVTGAPAVSLVIVTCPHPLADVPGGAGAQETVTSCWCHVPQLLGPGEHVGSGGAGGGALAAELGSARTAETAKTRRVNGRRVIRFWLSTDRLGSRG